MTLETGCKRLSPTRTAFGAQTASGVIGPVVEETLANTAPSFAGLDEDDDVTGVQIELEFGENSKGSIGDPLTAKDDDGDPRLYSISGGLDADCFSIGETSGQLSLSGERDFENANCSRARPAVMLGLRTRILTIARTVDGTNDYVVMIAATDPSGASGMATVTVSITDANEAAEFADAAEADANVTLYIDENENGYWHSTLSSWRCARMRLIRLSSRPLVPMTDVVAYTATDEDDNTNLDVPGAIRYSGRGC